MVETPDGMRIAPRGRPSGWQTFSVHRPLATHWRPATCAEVRCPQYLNGWRVRVELLTPKGLHNATHCGRKYVRVEAAPGETWLVYEAGQQCFQTLHHQKPLERPELYVLRGGDWRQPGDPVELSPTSWLDSFGENQEKLRDAKERG